MPYDLESVRRSFPALRSGAVYFDGPGGTQICQPAIDRMNQYLVETNANHGGAFATSQASDATIEAARLAMADFFNAKESEEIVFGPNMTSLTLAISRSLAQTLSASDEIVVTRLDHDANIAPWHHAARTAGCQLRTIDFDVEDCTLDLRGLKGALNDNTALVAVGLASNAVGTINPVAEIIESAKQVGALTYVDAVQYAPHRAIDVQALDCDFLVASAYKFFGPHVGVLHGKRDRLEALPAFKVRPAPDQPPGKFETGTQNHEGIAGVLGAVEYLAELGRSQGAPFLSQLEGQYSGRRLDLKAALALIEQYEAGLTRALLEGLESLPGIRIYGLTERDRLPLRVPTVSFRVEGIEPARVASRLGEVGIYLWHGNFYALAVTERLGVEEEGGLIRVGLVHYNSHQEIDRFLDGMQVVQAG